MMTINPNFAIMIVKMVIMLVMFMIISVDERGNAGTNHRSQADRKGTRSPPIFHMLLLLMIIDCRSEKLTLSGQAKSLCSQEPGFAV